MIENAEAPLNREDLARLAGLTLLGAVASIALTVAIWLGDLRLNLWAGRPPMGVAGGWTRPGAPLPEGQPTRPPTATPTATLVSRSGTVGERVAAGAPANTPHLRQGDATAAPASHTPTNPRPASGLPSATPAPPDPPPTHEPLPPTAVPTVAAPPSASPSATTPAGPTPSDTPPLPTSPTHTPTLTSTSGLTGTPSPTSTPAPTQTPTGAPSPTPSPTTALPTTVAPTPTPSATSAPLLASFSGIVKGQGERGVPGVTIHVNGIGTVVTDDNGNFAMSSLLPGGYLIWPAKEGCRFSPESRFVWLDPGEHETFDFRAHCGSGD